MVALGLILEGIFEVQLRFLSSVFLSARLVAAWQLVIETHLFVAKVYFLEILVITPLKMITFKWLTL